LFRELCAPQPRAELMPAALQLAGVEALHDGRILRSGVAVTRQHLENLRREVNAVLAVESRRLDLGINADDSAGSGVQRTNEPKLVFERHDPELDVVVPEAAGEHPLLRTRLPAFDDAQCPKLIERKVDDVETAVAAPSAGKAQRDVSDLVEAYVVQHDQPTVRRRDDILLEKVGALAIGEHLGFARMLGQVAAGAAMGDHEGRSVHGGSGPKAAWLF